jgi:multisubunit Na+/H+ antiporter MnhE subunit
VLARRGKGAPVSKRLAAYWVGWWVTSFGLWLLLTSTVTPNEMVTGVGCAAAAATIAAVVHATEPIRTTPRARLARHAAMLPWRVVVDTWLATGALVRHLAGGRLDDRFIEVRVPSERLAGQRRGFEVLSTIITTMSPNHLVVGFDEERRVALLHQLVRQDHETLEEVMGGK